MKALHGTGGVISAIAHKMGVARQSVYEYLERHPSLKDVVEHEREAMVDMAETSLFIKVREKEPWATKYILATKGKNRGYTEKREYSGEINLTGSVTHHISDEELSESIKNLHKK